MAKKCLLFVEDYPVIQEMFVGVLKREGFDVDIASDGREALAHAQEHSYDAVLLDILLPEMNGIEFLKHFLKLPGVSIKKTNIIVLTDFDDPKLLEEAKKLGVKHYWMKVENTPHELVEKVRKVLSDK